jgi:hypothetical protein
MLTFDHAFRNLLLNRIRGLTNENLLKYEGLVALQIELVQAWEVLQFEKGYDQFLNEPREVKLARLRRQIERAEELAHEIIQPFEKEFKALHALWIARRRLALRQGNYLQIPFGVEKLGSYLFAWVNYRQVQLKTCFTFLPVRFKDYLPVLRRLFGRDRRRKGD